MDAVPGMPSKMVGAFAPLMEICPDRATPELMQLRARLGSMLPYRQAAKVLADFLPTEPTETHATMRKRTIRIGKRLDDQVMQETLEREVPKCSFPGIGDPGIILEMPTVPRLQAARERGRRVDAV